MRNVMLVYRTRGSCGIARATKGPTAMTFSDKERSESHPRE